MTLWLTRIRMNPHHPVVKSDMGDITRLHRRVMSIAPDGLGPQARREAGVLFRLQTRGTAELLIQSGQEPDFKKIPEGYGQIDTRELTPLLDALDKDRTVRYRLAANPSKRLSSSSDRPGKIAALHGTDADDWWLRRAEANGLRLLTLKADPLTDATGNRHGGHRIRHTVKLFDGTATITDPDAVRHAVRAGIGRGKAYGCGLLSLAIAR